MQPDNTLNQIFEKLVQELDKQIKKDVKMDSEPEL
jgi:hypothetical protein